MPILRGRRSREFGKGLPDPSAQRWNGVDRHSRARGDADCWRRDQVGEDLIMLDNVSIWSILGKLVLTLVLGICIINLTDPKVGVAGKLSSSLITAFIVVFFV